MCSVARKVVHTSLIRWLPCVHPLRVGARGGPSSSSRAEGADMPDQQDQEQYDDGTLDSSVSRRAVLGAGVAGGLAAGAGALDPASAREGASSARHTTLAQTLVKGRKGK